MASFKKINLLNKQTIVLFATFSPWIGGRRLPTNGSLEPLRDFLVPKIKKLVLIDQVTAGSDFVMPRIEVYQEKEKVRLEKPSWWLFLLQPFLKLKKVPGRTYIIFKIRDFLSVIDCGLKDRCIYDFFIGLESINALAGIFLRKLGLVKKVIYYVSDYSPKRYPQKWFNWLYLALDRFCAMNADYIWDVSKAIQPARIKAGLEKNKSALVIHVPNGLYPSQIKYLSADKVAPHTLVYMGTLGPENGLDLAIEALPNILKKYPNATLHIVGGGRKTDIDRLKTTVRELKLEKNIIFYGYVPKTQDMAKIIRNKKVALALYRAFPGSPRFYGDAGKIRAYCGSGVPVITTDVPPLGREVVEKGGALMIRDTVKDVIRSVDQLFSDKKLYLKLRKHAIAFAKENTWENSFLNAFKQI